MPSALLSINAAAINRGIAVLGSTTIDRNIIGRTVHLKIGGVTAYAGLTYRRHGLNTWAVTNVAQADALILDVLTQNGIRIAGGPSAFTTRFINRVESGHRRQEAPSLAAPVVYAQLAAHAAEVDCVHLGPLHPDDIDPRLFEQLSYLPALKVLDVQGLVRKIVAGRVEPAVSEHLAAALEAAEIVKSDEDELLLILNAFGTSVEGLMGRFKISEWVMTSGSRGGCIHTTGLGRQPYAPAPISAVMDPTGAGDVFFAAYIVARLWNRKEPAEAARHAAKLAADHIAGRYLGNLCIIPRSKNFMPFLGP
jgi:1D-myo-inositol 3-kinase